MDNKRIGTQEYTLLRNIDNQNIGTQEQKD